MKKIKLLITVLAVTVILTLANPFSSHAQLIPPAGFAPLPTLSALGQLSAASLFDPYGLSIPPIVSPTGFGIDNAWLYTAHGSSTHPALFPIPSEVQAFGYPAGVTVPPGFNVNSIGISSITPPFVNTALQTLGLPLLPELTYNIFPVGLGNLTTSFGTPLGTGILPANLFNPFTGYI